MPAPIDLIGGFYRDDTLPWSCQDTVNYLPFMAEQPGTRTPVMLRTPPGLRPWQQIGPGPIRGVHDCEGLRLVVSGRWLYRINPDGIGMQVGVIPGVGRVSMTHNQFQTGYQVLIENGQSGGGYVYNTIDRTLVRITDEAYPGSISSDYLDSFLLGVEPFGRYWFHSDLASATSYNSLDRYEAETSPDKIVGLAVSGNEVVVFGQRTSDFFFNSGQGTGTFQNRNQSITRGCASRWTIQKLDNTVFWLGDDGIVYRLEGYAARPVSTRVLDRAIAGYNLAEAQSFVWEDRGFKVYYLTFPDGMTFGYDVISGLWHRRESYGLSRWRVGMTVKWGGKWYGGDFQNGRLWLIDWDYHLEGDQPIISERVSGVFSADQNPLSVACLELLIDTGDGPGTVPVEFPPQPTVPVPTGAAPDASVSAPYPPYQYTVTGGTAPFVFTVVSGALPAGMVLTASGELQGTPTTKGQSTFTIRVTDSIGLYGELTDTVQVDAVLVLNGYSPQNSASSRDGINWTLGGSCQPGAVFGVSNGRFVIESAQYQYSDNSGTSWQVLPSVRITGLDENDGLIIGGDGGASGRFRWGISRDGGLTYQFKENALSGIAYTMRILRADPQKILNIDWLSANKAFYSVDGGETFTGRIDFVYPFFAGCMVDDEDGFLLAGTNLSTSHSVLRINADMTAGPVRLIGTGDSSYMLEMVKADYPGRTVIMAFSQSGSIYYTEDKFVTTEKLAALPGTFRDATFNGTNFIVVMSSGVYYSANPRLGWTKAVVPIADPYNVGATSG